MAPRHRRAGPVDQLQQIPPADQDPGEIGERIPAQLERSRARTGPDRGRGRRSADMACRGVDGVVRVTVSIKGFPLRLRSLIRRGKRKRKGRVGCRASSTASIDAVLAAGDGPGGRIQIGRGRARAGRSSPTCRRPCPAMFDAFCALHAGDGRGDRRRRAADLRAS